MSWREEDAHQKHIEAQIANEVEQIQIRREARRRVGAQGRREIAWPEAWTLREQLQLPEVPTRWLVDGWLPAGGRVVFAAQAKAGKTTAVANLVRSLVDGAPWLGQFPVQQLRGRVAVIDFEMTPWQVRAWYRRQRILGDDRVILLPLRGQAAAFDLRDPDELERWAKILIDHQVELVIWDCLRPVMDALGLDENHDAGVLLTAFDELLAMVGQPAAVVVHHMGHGQDRARGDSRIIGWGDANWKLINDEKDPGGPRYASAYGRDVDQGEIQVQLDAETLRLTTTGASRKALEASAASDALLAVLRNADEPLNMGEIEAQGMLAGIARNAMREAVKQLGALGWITAAKGARNATLIALKPEFASSPEFAVSSPANAPASSPPPPKGRELASKQRRETEISSPASEPATGLTDEQRQMLAAMGVPITDGHEVAS